MFPYFRTRARTEVLFPPLGPALLSAHLKMVGVERARLRRHVQLVRRTPRRSGGLAAGDRRHLRHGEPHRQRLAHRRGRARAPARRPAGGGRSAADRVPGPLSAARRRRDPRRGRRQLPRVLPRLPGAWGHAGNDLRLAARRVRRPGHGRRRHPRGQRTGASLAGGDRRVSAARPRRLRPPRLPARVGAHRLPADHVARDPGLSLRVRVLLQAGLRQRRPAAPARGGHGGDRRHRPPGLRRPVDRRRHVHTRP